LKYRRSASAEGWLNLSVAPMTTTPLNKGAVVCCFFLLVVLAPLCLPLASHGGGGKKIDWAWRCGAGGGGSVAALAHVRGAG
jgi:hypothetical protein